MNDDAMRRAYENAMTTTRASGHECPSVDVLHELATTLRYSEHGTSSLEHVMSCAACRSEYELLRSIHVAERARTVSWTRHWSRYALAASLIGAVGVGTLWWPGAQSGEMLNDVTRGASVQQPTADGSAVAMVAPPRHVSRSDSLRLTWHTVRGADGYRISLLNDAGDALHVVIVGDTTVALSPTVLPTGAMDFTWLVVALRADGNERRSTLHRVTIVP